MLPTAGRVRLLGRCPIWGLIVILFRDGLEVEASLPRPAEALGADRRQRVDGADASPTATQGSEESARDAPLGAAEHAGHRAIAGASL